MSAITPLSPNSPVPIGAHPDPRRATRTCSLALLALVAMPTLPAATMMTGCKPAVRVDNPSPFDEDDPAALPDRATGEHPTSQPGAANDAAHAASSPSIARARASSPGLRTMTVARADLHAALDRGPGAFLRGVEVKPHFLGDRFGGWEIVQFMPGEVRFDPFDLRPGDIIARVNGHFIARPQHLAALWSELRSAATIVIQVQRGQGAFELRFEVSDEAKPATP